MLHAYLAGQSKVEKILEDSLDSIPSPSPSVKNQIIGGKVYLRVIRQNIAGWCQQNFVFKSLLTTPRNVLPLHLKQTFPPIIRIFTDGEGDGIKSRLPFKILSTLLKNSSNSYYINYYRYYNLTIFSNLLQIKQITIS